MRWTPVVVVVAIGAVVWWRTHHPAQSAASSLVQDQLERDDSRSVEPSSSFRCEGKTRCSQMSSCEEATFYLRNCPGVKIDGDNDGVPCESQFCQ